MKRAIRDVLTRVKADKFPSRRQSLKEEIAALIAEGRIVPGDTATIIKSGKEIINPQILKGQFRKTDGTMTSEYVYHGAD